MEAIEVEVMREEFTSASDQRTANRDTFPPHVAQRISALMEEKLDRVIRRLVTREGYAMEKAAKIRVEFLRFVSLKFITEETIAPSPDVDAFWHTFILHTRDYADFCQRHLGRFMHHEPQEHAQSLELREGTPGMHTKRLLEQMYPGHDREIWATTAICEDQCDDAPGCKD